MEKNNWQKWAAVAICCAGAGAAVLIGLRVAVPFLLPFLLAWGLAVCVTPLAEKLSRWLHLPQRLCAVVLLTLVLAALVLAVGATVNRLLRELQGLVERLLASGSFPSEALREPFDYFEQLTANSRFWQDGERAARYAIFRESFNQMVADALQNGLAALSAELPRVAARLLGAMPSVLLFAAVTVIAGFYFCTDRKGLERAAASVLPRRVQKSLPAMQEKLRQLSWRYLRAYLLLLLLTFAELFLGLTLLRVEYAFLLAAVIAAVDILPVLGVGTVLVPWAVVALLQKNHRLGIGLLILYLVVTVLRQIVEPKLVGQSLGLHPLLTLAAGYAGFRAFGVLGMMIAPFFALLCKNLFCRLQKNASESAQE